jgi:hypothetical protein
LKGLKTVSVVDALVSSRRTRVLDGEIDAGVGLTETDVATEHEVSRPTAKTAINQLVLEGLLRREAHKSAHVPNLSRDDVDDLFLVRIPLELEVVTGRRGGVPEAAGKAVRDLAAVGAGAGHDEFVEASLRFHRVLVRGRQPAADPVVPGAQRGDPPVDGAIQVRIGPRSHGRRARRCADRAGAARRRCSRIIDACPSRGRPGRPRRAVRSVGRAGPLTHGERRHPRKSRSPYRRTFTGSGRNAGSRSGRIRCSFRQGADIHHAVTRNSSRGHQRRHHRHRAGHHAPDITRRTSRAGHQREITLR